MLLYVGKLKCHCVKKYTWASLINPLNPILGISQQDSQNGWTFRKEQIYKFRLSISGGEMGVEGEKEGGKDRPPGDPWETQVNDVYRV